MRPIWSGNISFGLINIPVEMYSAERGDEPHFHMIDSRNNSRVRYQRINEETGEEVPWSEIVKGYELEDGDYVLLGDQEMESLAREVSGSLDLEEFVPLDQIGTMYFDKPYVLAPKKKAEKGYVLLRDVLAQQEKAGIVKVVIRKREHLAAIIAVEDALVLHLLRFVHELRDLSEFDLPAGDEADYGIKKAELDLSARLVDSLSNEEWDAARYHDEYGQALKRWIEKKKTAGRTHVIEEPEEVKPAAATNVIDIAALLQRSLEKNKGQKKAGKKRGQAGSRRKGKRTG